MPDRSDPLAPDPFTRRRFIAVSGAALGLAPLAPLLAGCAGDPVVSATCPGYAALTPEQLQTRATLAYVDVTPELGKLCSNCKFYNLPTGQTSPCGGCQLFQGPVAPGGYCTSWASRA